MSELQVRGGAGGLEVQYDELLRVAGVVADEGVALVGLAVGRHALLADPDLLAAAALAPGAAARATAALLAALDGPDGVARAGVELEERAARLLLAVARYRAAEAGAAALVELRSWALLSAAPLVVPVAAGWLVGVTARGGDPADAAGDLVSAHAHLVDDLIGGLVGMTAPLRAGLVGPLPVLADSGFRAVTGERLLPRDLPEAAGLLALLYADGEPVLRSRDDRSVAATRVPTGVGDLLARLDHRNREAAGEQSGDIGVTRLVTPQPDGSEQVAWIVDLPGTKDWQLDPRERAGLNDLATNLELMAGTPNARVEALGRALERSGAGRGDPVLLVGHSQGGMVAVRAAAELQHRWSVTHVVTAGSPVGAMPVPAGVAVLSLENARDVVPQTDARDNPDELARVTVGFVTETGSIGGNHALPTAYVPAARAVDDSADPSVLAWRESAAPFLPGAGSTATTTVWTVTNVGDPR